MKVLVAGASGAIGVPLTRRLLAHGHQVLGLTRGPAGARRRLPVACGGVLGWIHHEDAAAATVAALEHGRPGQAYNLVDDLPATWQEVWTAMAEAFGAPPPRRVPRWLFRLAAPYVASFAVDTSMRVANAKAKRELGWQPMFPTHRQGILAMVAGAPGRLTV
jgi:nucleoside-diphosphate-sugar epimerase